MKIFKNFLKAKNNFNKCFSTINSLTCLSPLDGRYSVQVKSLNNYFSEYGLIKYRTKVEIEWLKFLISKVFTRDELSNKFECSEGNLPNIITILDSCLNNFNLESAEKIKAIEKETNHDVKAVEYFIKQYFNKIDGFPHKILELVHFCCTSEDINNLSWSIMVNESLENSYYPSLNSVISNISNISQKYSDVPMMSKTHGQPATPTTVGKEFANFAYRINEQLVKLKSTRLKGKINGAVGNYNSHLIVLPEKNWPELTKIFVNQLGLEWNPYTTQIENHDSLAEIFNHVSLANTIKIGLCRDVWGYISQNYFKQKLKANEIGSSTMPHKVNPIDFENAEGNLGIANSLFNHMSNKLPISRFQRDLSDSTVLRNIGSAFGYTTLALNSLEKGLNKLEINREVITHELNSHYELLSEPLQTVMRYYGFENPYEQMKGLTRGKSFTKEDYLNFVENLNLPQNVKNDLKQLSPENYLGNAEEMAKNINNYLKL